MSQLLQFILDNQNQFRRGRLPSLYSDFRQQKYSNPDGYAANVAAWESALSHAAGAGLASGSINETFSIRTGLELAKGLETTEWGSPAALGTIISEIVSSGHFIPIDTFLHSTIRVDENPLPKQPWSLLSWSLNQLGVSKLLPDRIPHGDFVILSNVQTAADKVMKLSLHRAGRVDRIMPMNEFKRVLNDSLGLATSMSNADLKVLLTYLSRDRGELAYTDHVIKFRSAEPGLPIITDSDESIASLKALILDLNDQSVQVAKEIESLMVQARGALANKNRSTASRLLKSKKIQENLLVQRGETLVQLESVLGQIEQAANHVQVVGVLKSSAGVLRGLNIEVGDPDKFRDLLESLSDEMVKTNQINEAIGENNAATVAVDEAEIDSELDALEAENRTRLDEQAATQLRKTFDSLPKLTDTVIGSGLAEKEGIRNTTDAFKRLSLDKGEGMNLERKELASAG